MALEIAHHGKWGHLVAYGLHLDVNQDSGQGLITNYSLRPAEVVAETAGIEFIGISDKGIALVFLQKFDARSNDWLTVNSGMKSKRVIIELAPGKSLPCGPTRWPELTPHDRARLMIFQGPPTVTGTTQSYHAIVSPEFQQRR